MKNVLIKNYFNLFKCKFFKLLELNKIKKLKKPISHFILKQNLI
jgi:hypothetical protein